MANALEKIKELIKQAKSQLVELYSSDAYTFNVKYVEPEDGLKKSIIESGIVFPIQFEDSCDFYLFNKPEDLIIYIIETLKYEGVLYDENDEDWNSSGCEGWSSSGC